MTLERDKAGEVTTIMLFQTRHTNPETTKDIAAVKRLLGLRPDAETFKVTYGSDTRGDQEIAIHTRSGFQVLLELAARASVPPEHVTEQRTMEEKPPDMMGKEFRMPPLVTINSGQERPLDAFVQVRYRDHWFWINDKDFPSKGVFSFLMMLFTLSESGQKVQPPVLTIRAN